MQKMASVGGSLLGHEQKPDSRAVCRLVEV